MSSPNSHPLQEGEDYIFDDQGRMVFTREYHLKRGTCCGSGCLNCPYDTGPSDTSDTDPDRPS